MADPKTVPTGASVEKFIAAIPDESRREDCTALVKLMRGVTRAQPRMWGPSIVGFGTYHYVYASGREGDWPLVGFSPRKQDLSLYLMCQFERHSALMKKLGKYKTGKSCLYLKRLADVDLKVLRELVRVSFAETKARHRKA